MAKAGTLPGRDPGLQARIREAIPKVPAQMTLQLARHLGVAEVDVLRNLPDSMAVELDVTRWRQIFEALPGLGTVHVIVTNGVATLEAEGEFGGFSTWGEFFNVQTPTLDMHIRPDSLGAIFAAEKPGSSPERAVRSFQFFDRDGHAAFKVILNFGGQPLAADVRREFDEISAAYRAV